jgi:hypothetical protein
MLLVAMQQGSDVHGLCRLPAAQQLTSQEVLQLLDAAVNLADLAS